MVDVLEDRYIHPMKMCIDVDFSLTSMKKIDNLLVLDGRCPADWYNEYMRSMQ